MTNRRCSYMKLFGFFFFAIHMRRDGEVGTFLLKTILVENAKAYAVASVCEVTRL